MGHKWHVQGERSREQQCPARDLVPVATQSQLLQPEKSLPYRSRTRPGTPHVAHAGTRWHHGPLDADLLDDLEASGPSADQGATSTGEGTTRVP